MTTPTMPPPEKVTDLLWEDETYFRVHTRAYTDPGVFNLEMEQIFNRAWIFVAHTSQIPNTGDYVTAYVGLQPVIVSRGQDRKVHVFYNRCVHRGSVVCRTPAGNANYFRCPYHGWVYANDGTLTGVAMRKGYPDDFDMPEGLVKVPRVEIYRGLIFVSGAGSGTSLEEFLSEEWAGQMTTAGPYKTIIDRKFDKSLEGEIEVLPDPIVVRYKGNWKFQAENMIDGYHFFEVHEPMIKLQARYGDSTGDYGAHRGKNVQEMKEVRDIGRWTDEELDSRLRGDWGDDISEYYSKLVAKHGRRQVCVMEGGGAGGAALVYPSFGIIHHHLRVIRPISVDETEVTLWFYNLKGAPEAHNQGWLRSQERFYGPSGYGMPDDVEMFALNQQGLAASKVDWLILERGLDRERAGEPAIFGDEARIRAQWRIWRSLMSEGTGHISLNGGR